MILTKIRDKHSSLAVSAASMLMAPFSWKVLIVWRILIPLQPCGSIGSCLLGELISKQTSACYD